MRTISFKIYGLDCIEEIKLIKSILSPTINEEHLLFDLLNGKLTITDLPSSLLDEDIVYKLKKSGMTAILWEEFQSNTENTSFLTLHSRTLLTLLSALFLLTGFITHVYLDGLMNAIVGGHTTKLSYEYPIITKTLYLLAMISGGFFIFPKALHSLRRLSADMNLLMVIAVLGAVAINQWMEAATVTTLFSVALLLESWSIGRARAAIEKLLDISPTKANVYCPHHNTFDNKDIESVAIGSRILVKPGEKIPLDGKVVKGRPNINEAPITGESQYVDKTVDSMVYAGSINGQVSFEFITTKKACDSTLARIIMMIQEAQSRRAHSERWVETFAKYYTPFMMILAIGLAIIPPLIFNGNWLGWFYEALVILVIACPCALVISTPVSIVAGLSAAARNGILIKGGNFLEIPSKLKALAFDKTGTLTQGKPVIKKLIPTNSHTEEQLLTIAASLESHSSHPLAIAILDKTKAMNIQVKQVNHFTQIEGLGAEGYINDNYYWIGSHRFLHEKYSNLECDALHQTALTLEDEGHSLVFMGNRDHICGLISFADILRPKTANVIKQLYKLGIMHISMLTGDNKGTAAAIAQNVGISDYYAELLPEDKVATLNKLKARYHTIAMVGDGINDAPAMANATLGIAMGAIGTDAAIETADIALMSDDLALIPRLVAHSKRVLTIIKQNISFALALKLLFIILALMEVATLWMAIAADMGASLLVIFNALRLLKMK
jgi:Zn2+/Cd2+-exporting ATPase